MYFCEVPVAADCWRVEPPEDVVYHITREEHLDGILRDGLVPGSHLERVSPWSLAVDRFFDEHRPPNIVDLGVSRVEGVFAHPDIVHLSQSSDGVRGGEAGRRPVVAITVDPERVLVMDGFDSGEMCDYASDAFEFRQKWRPSEDLERQVIRCWNNSRNLTEFRDQYPLTQVGNNGERYTYAFDAQGTLPPGSFAKFLAPEVIIPGPIPPERLAHVATIIVPPASC